MNIFLHICFAYGDVHMQKESSIANEDVDFWNRMNFLIGDERPFPWSERVGLNKSSFQSARSRCKKPLPKTLKQWAERIGCSYEWLNNGVGVPFPTENYDDVINRQVEEACQGKIDASAPVEFEGDVPAGFYEDVSVELDSSLLIQAFETLSNALQVTGRTMQPSGRARFVAAVYASLKENEDMDTQLLQDCIFTIEEALKSTRRTMSPKSKTDLILIIYELYSGDASYKEAMTSTINNLIRSVS